MHVRIYLFGILFTMTIISISTMYLFHSKNQTSDSFVTLFNQATQFLQDHQFDQAIACYKEVISLDQDCIAAHFNLGQAYIKKQNPHEAIQSFKKVLQLAPHASFTHQIYMQLGAAYTMLNQTDQALQAYAQVIMQNPSNAAAHFKRAQVFQNQQDYEKAIEDYIKACQLDRSFLDALLALGTDLRDQGIFDLAIRCFKHAQKIKPDDARIYRYLADILNIIGKATRDEKKIIGAQRLYEKVCELDPMCDEAYHNLGLMFSEQGKLKQAMNMYKQVLKINPDSPNTKFCLGMVQLKLGNLKEGFANYEYRWQKLRQNIFKDIPYCELDNVQGKRILIHAEQGLGDTFQFIRYGQLLKDRGAKVIAWVHKPLKTILSYCPYVDMVIGYDEPVPCVDAQVPFLSLPYIFKTELESIPQTIPYLYADQQLVQSWAEKLAGDSNFKIGVCWHVDATHDSMIYNKKDHKQIRVSNPFRSIALQEFAQLALIPDITLYSLQINHDIEQDKLPAGISVHTFDQALAKKNHDKKVIYIFDKDFDKAHGSFMDTAAIMKNLNLVITVDTSVAHLAGGLGVPVWILLPHVAEWRWLEDRNDSPWYPKAQLFRQPKSGDWQSVMQRVTQEIKNLLNQKNVA